MIALLLAIFLHLYTNKALPIISPIGSVLATHEEVLASHEFSLDKRYAEASVNHVFKENILLNLAYMRNVVASDGPIDWTLVDKPFHWELTLAPGETISYHNYILPKYKNVMPLAKLNFNGAEGFLSDGWLTGDGVCHLASLIGWAARDAGLVVEAPTNHDFAAIPEVPKSEGVAIYSQPASPGSSALQNLYIQNNKGKNVRLVFHYADNKLKVSVVEAKSDLAMVKH